MSGRTRRQASVRIAYLLIAFTLLAGLHHHGFEADQLDGGRYGDECPACHASRDAGIPPSPQGAAAPLVTCDELADAIPLVHFERAQRATASRGPPAPSSSS